MKHRKKLVTSSVLSIGKFYFETYVSLISFSTKEWYRITLYAFILLILVLLPGRKILDKPLPQVFGEQTVQLPINLPPPAPYPLNLGLFPPPELTAGGVMIVDVGSGVPLYQKNPDVKLQPASTTKIMTALVALDHYPLNQVLEVKTAISEGRVMGLFQGERLTVESLLDGLLIHSANDAAIVLAENYPGGIPGFVAAMNEKAKSLYLVDSHFTNPVGFEEEGHVMSARDLIQLSKVASAQPTIAKIVSTRSITVSDVSYSYFHDLVNVNRLLGKIPGVAGLKTGWTENARECLVTLQVKDKGKILVVLLRSSDRFGETEKLLSWVDQNFTWEQVKSL